MTGFNTQPPEGGWLFHHMSSQHKKQFQHTAARRRLGSLNEAFIANDMVFQHTAARRRLVLF